MKPTKVQWHFRVEGVVQGVGFRPFVYRLAQESGLTGWIKNGPSGVELAVEGFPSELETFSTRLQMELPVLAVIHHLHQEIHPASGYQDFRILTSGKEGHPNAKVIPDVATCQQCLQEVFDPTNRRHLYPFTNCTHCGPRYSILEKLPYDRSHTSMKHFPMCDLCLNEYNDPRDRRFHAQPNACPQCGPRLEVRNHKGKRLCRGNDSLLIAVEALRQGKIVAIKGIGGFHLAVDAFQKESIHQLRQRKARSDKPFAVMYPTIEKLVEVAHVNSQEKTLLQSPEAPIVLLEKKDHEALEWVSSHNHLLGALLPYSPLHWMLFQHFPGPLVMTSANISEEPICIDNEEAMQRLTGIADLFLLHDRPIVRPLDDSVVQVVNNKLMVLRMGRGYAPFYFSLPSPPLAQSLLAVGGHQKTTVSFAHSHEITTSQHLGDMDSSASQQLFEKEILDWQQLHEIRPERIVKDKHPRYFSTQWAEKQELSSSEVQHHQAHAWGAWLEAKQPRSALAFSWDGTGYGDKQDLWGSEVLLLLPPVCERLGCLKPFPLPGGYLAIKEPRRSALGLVYAHQGAAGLSPWDDLMASYSQTESTLLLQMLERKIHSPWTSGMGRLFDAFAGLIGVSAKVSFEAQAAIALEKLAAGSKTHEAYSLTWSTGEIDWRPMLAEILHDKRQKVPAQDMAKKFHNGLAQVGLAIAQSVAQEYEFEKVLLTGGCFQNRILLKLLSKKLESHGFQVFWPQRAPINDGGLSFGQVAAMVGQNSCI